MNIMVITPSLPASPSSRRAWIEISMSCACASLPTVALLAEGVDRNSQFPSHTPSRSVALLAEGVDRNSARKISLPSTLVALLAEGVDRNISIASRSRVEKPSPSSRRAWIEIGQLDQPQRPDAVALLAEGVDRNLCVGAFDVLQQQSPSSRRAWIEIKSGLRFPARRSQSPSSRRAWIEIACPSRPAAARWVALLAEGVDRNRVVNDAVQMRPSRPPRGGRG